MADNTDKLVARIAEITNLHRAAAVLEWDLQTYMPPGGAPARADQIATLSKLAHEQFIAPETGRLLEAAEQEALNLDPDSDEVRICRNVRRDYNHAVKIPTELAEELARHAALSQEIWTRARANNDFAAFAPSLEKTFELVRRQADYLGYQDDPYDALLDLYEPGAKTADVAAMFAELRPHLVDLVRRIIESPRRADDVFIEGSFPTDVQNRVTLEIVKALGYDLSRGRQDQAAHPFCTNFSRDDVRITTRFDTKHLDGSIYSSIHETGHALYEQGIPEEYDNTPLGGAASLGVHESQSRMWENLVGRSRGFCAYVLPIMRDAFPGPFATVDAEYFYRAINRVTPSFIRTEADEVTYNLHVLLRFELERELLSGRLTVADLPEAWNEKMREYLGITPPDYARGVLQDIHWAGAMVGYFPTYTLGNLLAAQLWHTIHLAIPDVDDQIRRGEFQPLLLWLRENVHRYGSRYLPSELVPKATGEPLTSRFFVAYLQVKYGEIYGLR